MKTKLEISNNVVENAVCIYKKVVNTKLTRKRRINSLIASSLYAACRKNNIARTLNDIAESGNVERRILSRDLRTVIKKIQLNLNGYDTALFISNNMSLKKTNQDVFEILRHGNKTDYCGEIPCAQAAALLYIVGITNCEKISQKKFSVESGVSDVTIRNEAVLIEKILKQM